MLQVWAYQTVLVWVLSSLSQLVMSLVISCYWHWLLQLSSSWTSNITTVISPMGPENSCYAGTQPWLSISVTPAMQQHQWLWGKYRIVFNAQHFSSPLSAIFQWPCRILMILSDVICSHHWPDPLSLVVCRARGQRWKSSRLCFS